MKETNVFKLKLPFDGVSVDGLLDVVKRPAEVTAKDRLKVVFVPDPLLPTSILYDVGLTVTTKCNHMFRRDFD